MPDTPISESAARTSSSLKGLIMAVINFIVDSGQLWAVAAILLRLYATGTAICDGSIAGGVTPAIALSGAVPTRYKGIHDFHHPHHRRRPGRRAGHRYPAAGGLQRPSGAGWRRAGAALSAPAPVEEIPVG